MEPIIFSVVSILAVTILLAAVTDEAVEAVNGELIASRVLAATSFLVLAFFLATINLRMWLVILSGG